MKLNNVTVKIFVPYRGIYFLYCKPVPYKGNFGEDFRPLSGNLLSLRILIFAQYAGRYFRPLSGNLLSLQQSENETVQRN